MAVPRITREELKARLDSPDSSSHPIIVDVRLKYPYEHSTVILPGAQRILPDAIASATLPRGRDIVLYDSDPQDIVSSGAAADLLRRGHRAFVLQGGISEWMNAKLPVATKSAPQPAAPAAKAAPAAGAAPPAKPANGAPAAPNPATGAPAPPKPASGAPAADKAAPAQPAADKSAPDQPPAASSAAAAAPKSAGPAAVEGPATPTTESKD